MGGRVGAGAARPTAAGGGGRRRPQSPSPPPAQAQANDALRRGAQLRKKFYVKEGLGLYNEALALPFSDDALRAVLLSNRAQVRGLGGWWWMWG